MKGSVFITICCFGLFFIANQAFSEVITFPVVGEYDGSAKGNVVDGNAAFYEGNSSGVGNDASLTIKIGSFRDEIQKAFTNGCGGVVGFDNALIAGGTQTDSFAASFGEEKSLVVKSVDHVRTDFIATNICVPISGPGACTNGGFLAKSIVGDDKIKIRSSFNFTFDEQGFSEREHVCAVGGTILGRNGAAEASRWLMKVTLDNGDIIAQIAEINFRSGNSRADTFFGARAPKGRYITGVAWINLDGSHSGLDGFAFITNGPPPKRKVKKADESDSSTFFGIGTGTGGNGGGDNESSGGDSYSLLFGTER